MCVCGDNDDIILVGINVNERKIRYNLNMVPFCVCIF